MTPRTENSLWLRWHSPWPALLLALMGSGCFDGRPDFDDAPDVCHAEDAVGVWLRCAEQPPVPTMSCPLLGAEGFAIDDDGTWSAIAATDASAAPDASREYCVREDLQGRWSFEDGRVQLKLDKSTVAELHPACLLDSLSTTQASAQRAERAMLPTGTFERAQAESLGACPPVAP